MNLLADASATFRLDCLGHSLMATVRPNDALEKLDLDALRLRGSGRLFGAAAIDALTSELLADDDVNFALVPDVVERAFYNRVFNFYSVVLDYVLRDVRLRVLDVDLDLALERDDA